MTNRQDRGIQTSTGRHRYWILERANARIAALVIACVLIATLWIASHRRAMQLKVSTLVAQSHRGILSLDIYRPYPAGPDLPPPSSRVDGLGFSLALNHVRHEMSTGGLATHRTWLTHSAGVPLWFLLLAASLSLASLARQPSATGKVEKARHSPG